MQPEITSLDHFVLTVADIDATMQFYTKALGMQPLSFKAADGTTRWALRFGPHKINLHLAGHEFDPKAKTPTAGSGDFCMLSKTPLADWIAHLQGLDVQIEEGPVARTGATGPITSIYVRDPDLNLIEIAVRT